MNEGAQPELGIGPNHGSRTAPRPSTLPGVQFPFLASTSSKTTCGVETSKESANAPAGAHSARVVIAMSEVLSVDLIFLAVVVEWVHKCYFTLAQKLQAMTEQVVGPEVSDRTCRTPASFPLVEVRCGALPCAYRWSH